MQYRKTFVPGTQRGAVLIVALVMLLVLTVLGTASIRDTTMEERMAGNFRDRTAALEAAETALRTGEAGISNTTVYSALAFDGTDGSYEVTQASVSVDPETGTNYGLSVAASVLSDSGKLLVDRGAYGESSAYFERCLTLRPGHLEARFLLGLAASRTDDPATARAAFEAVGRATRAAGKAYMTFVRDAAQAAEWQRPPWKELHFAPGGPHYYQYRFTSYGEQRDVPDIYCKAATKDSSKSMVINLDLTDPPAELVGAVSRELGECGVVRRQSSVVCLTSLRMQRAVRGSSSLRP